MRIDDTAEWRLIIHITKTGMSAYLKSEEDPMEPLITLFNVHWEEDEKKLLKRIEDTVYDHPQLLDDFSTEIVVNTAKALWIPKGVTEPSAPGKDYPDLDETDIYNIVYPAAEEDIFIDDVNDMMCLYTLVAGLYPFIRRTLPGARTWCQQSLAVRKFAGQLSDMPRLYVDIREDEADYYAFDGHKLLFAATHPYRSNTDIEDRIENFMSLWNLSAGNTKVMLSGKKDVRGELMVRLREKMQYVMLAMLPSAVSRSELPVSVGLAIARK